MQLLLLLAAAIGQTYEEEAPTMLADFAAMSKTDQYYTRYLSTHTIPQEFNAEAVQAWWLPHLSPNAVLERQVPRRIGKPVTPTFSGSPSIAS